MNFFLLCHSGLKIFKLLKTCKTCYKKNVFGDTLLPQYAMNDICETLLYTHVRHVMWEYCRPARDTIKTLTIEYKQKVKVKGQVLGQEIIGTA